jgi:arylsulfatase A-like enzyme
VVLIVTDDQRWDTLRFMPAVRLHLVEAGTTFTNAFVVNPLCCPSRASILTGDASHTTGVYTLGGPLGSRSFDPSSTIATWLDDAGYRTALAGKYLNHFRGPEVPPGWDRWWSYSGPYAYYDYLVDENGTLVRRGTSARDYATDVFASRADRFIRSTPPDTPLFLHFSPYAPHAPATPADRHADAFPDLPAHRPPGYDEVDVADKPAWVRGPPRLSSLDVAYLDGLRRRQLQAGLSIDDAVARIVDALADTGRLEDTILVFTSDNGFLWGEHRWTNKIVAYDESIRVPLVVRYDALEDPPARVDSLVANIDIAPTIAAMAGIDAPSMDGESLEPLLRGTGATVRGSVLVEHVGTVRAGGRKPSVPSYCALRTTGWLFVRYSTGEEELYSVRDDPYQLTNLVAEVGARALSTWRGRLARRCVLSARGVPVQP